MSKWYKIIAVFVILGALGGILGYYFVYNKPHTDYEKAAPDYRITGQQLFHEFTDNATLAQQAYNGKVLEVSGTVTSVENPDSLTIVVFALNEGLFGDEGIRFTMLEAYHKDANALHPGDAITIKGYCTGYNDTDIILEKCSFPGKNNH